MQHVSSYGYLNNLQSKGRPRRFNFWTKRYNVSQRVTSIQKSSALKYELYIYRQINFAWPNQIGDPPELADQVGGCSVGLRTKKRVIIRPP